MHRSVVPFVSALSVIALLASSPCLAQIINHSHIDEVASLPQATMNAIGQQKWFFSHASVGGNMIDGMSSLH